MAPAQSDKLSETEWLSRFHAGAPEVMSDCYRQHFRSVSETVGRVLQHGDRETVVHEVFHRLLESQDLRRSYGGGTFGAWINRVAHNHAIDFARRWKREQALANADENTGGLDDLEGRLAAQRVIEQFRKEHLPAKWVRVFEVRFLRQLDQRSAARELKMNRTTLAYQEHRVRALLKTFLLKQEIHAWK